MSTLSLSVVEAEPAERERLARMSEERGWKAQRYASVADFAAAESEGAPHLLLFSVPDGFGNREDDADVSDLRSWRERNPQTQIVLLLPANHEHGDRLALILGARHILHAPFRAEAPRARHEGRRVHPHLPAPLPIRGRARGVPEDVRPGCHSHPTER